MSSRSVHGVSLVEVMLAIVVFTALFLPGYTLLVQSRDTTYKSKLAYMSVQAAREEIEDLRLMTRLDPDGIDKLFHDWKPLEPHALDRIRPLLAESQRQQAPESLKYPAEYKRIYTKVEIGAPHKGYNYPCVLHVRWQETGEKFTAESTKQKPGFSRFDFYLVRPPRGF